MEIYTVITFFSGSNELCINDIQSFKTLTEAQEYGFTIHWKYEIIKNKLN